MISPMLTHHFLESDASLEKTIEVRETQIPFNEMILSWNGFRPKTGSWSFSASLFQDHWSEWLPLAEWGQGRQKTFICDPQGSFTKSYQDVAIVKSGLCSGYKIRIRAEDGATLTTLRSITVSFGEPSLFVPKPLYDLPSVRLAGVPSMSQQILSHPRAKDLCSPTSVTSAINFLLKNRSTDPVLFAEQACDQSFDIYGNWILNTAAAFEALQGNYQTYVARLPDFGAIHAQLTKGLPVVVSVKGPLLGAPLPYANGHLILVTGYDQKTRQVLCMDPAYPTDEQTLTSYPLDEFLIAWTVRRMNLAYLFEKKV